MKNMFAGVIVVCYTLLSVSCIAEKKGGSCNQETAIVVSDNVIKKAGYNLNSLRKDVKVFSEYYYIHYTRTDTLIRGNEAEIEISRKNCKVTKRKFYQ